MTKQRLTITVDPHLLEEGHKAVQAGAADSISSWISAAIQDKVGRDQKLAHLAEAVANFEAEHGEISAEEMAAQRRLDRSAATVVRGTPKSA